jgi:hypothetical protein
MTPNFEDNHVQVEKLEALATGFHTDIPLAAFISSEWPLLVIAGKLNKEARSTSKLIYSQHFLHSKE